MDRDELDREISKELSKRTVDTGIFRTPTRAASHTASLLVLLNEAARRCESGEDIDFDQLVPPQFSIEKEVAQIRARFQKVFDEHARPDCTIEEVKAECEEVFQEILAQSSSEEVVSAFNQAVDALWQLKSIRKIQDDAPPQAHDAEKGLLLIERIQSLIDGRENLAAIEAAYQLGVVSCRFHTRPFERYAKDGRRQVLIRQKGGKSSAALTDAEWESVIAERTKLVKVDPRGGAKNAAKLIYSKLIRGECPGVDRIIDPSRIPKPHTIATKRLKR